MLSKKSKKSLKSSQRHISLGLPTNIAVGPLGFRAQLDTDSKGRRDRSYRDLESDQSDSTMTIDEKDAKASRIVFHNNESGDQGHPVPESSTTGAAVGGEESENGLAGEFF